MESKAKALAAIDLAIAKAEALDSKMKCNKIYASVLRVLWSPKL